MEITQLDQLLAYPGILQLEIHGVQFQLNMGMPHERRYALRHLFDCRYPQADIDTLIFEHFLKKGDCVLDAGANIGITAVEALAMGARSVICVEPEPSLAARLRDLSHPALEVHECALGDAEGSVELFLSETHNQGHTIDPNTKEKFSQIFGQRAVNVPLRPVERILGDRYCDFWKMDIEGAEVNVIRASRTLFQRTRPRVIVMEIYQDNLDVILGILSEFYVCKRAAISKPDYRLVMLPPTKEPFPEGCETTSPMYVFVDKRFASMSGE